MNGLMAIEDVVRNNRVLKKEGEETKARLDRPIQ